jgi:hypothetical protein
MAMKQQETDLPQRIYKARKAWAEKRAEWRKYDALEKSLLAELRRSSNASTANERDDAARSDKRYKEWVMQLRKAEFEMNLAWAEYEGLQASFEAWKEMNATHRKEMGLV